MSTHLGPALLNDRFLRACRLEPVDETPVWLMRQAGRYLPEYNKTRAKAGSFLQLAKNPTYASEVTLQPLDRYPQLDAAILFSDILTIPDAMGLGLEFLQGEGPQFSNPLRDEKSVKDLQVADMDQLQYVFDAVSQIRKDLMQGGQQRVPLIGFSGSPWTLACYMVEGSGSKDFQETKTMLYKRPDLIRRILDINIQSIVEYLSLQIRAGAQAVMLFDTWGGLLSHQDYVEYSLSTMREVISRLKKSLGTESVPVLLFTKGGGVWLEQLASSGADVIGLDWNVSLGKAKAQLNTAGVAIQGNLDPLILLGDQKIINEKICELFNELALTNSFGPDLRPLDGHIFNLGHGISQFTPPENVKFMLELVKSESTKLRRLL